MQDKETKGRGNHAFGEANHAKLREQDVRRIHERHATGAFSYQGLGDIFGVSHTTIRYIIVGKKWGHLLPQKRRTVKRRRVLMKHSHTLGGTTKQVN